jgi:biopolymer transport protein ExbB/TolQ
MDVFALIVLAGIALAFLALIGLAFWNKQSVGEIAGKSDQRRWGVQAQVEGRDVPEMVEAHNESRRRRGKAEVSEAEIQAEANRSQRASIERARKAAAESD